MDVMYLDGKPVLHIVDEGTRFSAARSVPDVSTKTIWRTFLECWAAVYTGLPHKILVDQATYFGPVFATIGALARVEVQRTGTEAHSSLGLGEHYHEPLRTTFRKLKAASPDADPAFLLGFSAKAMKDTVGPEGLVPSALVFGKYPSTRKSDDPLQEWPTLASCAKLALIARQEMAQIMAKMRVSRGLRHAVPPSADISFSPGYHVLVWRENQVNNRIGEWVGPFTVQSLDPDKKLVHVRDDFDRSLSQFN